MIYRLDMQSKKETPRVFVSGVHSSVNPLPGIGLAHSLRATFKDIEIIPVDYSPKSSGLYWEGFDRPLLLSSWSVRSPEEHLAFVEQKLSIGNSFWISCLDLEVEILTSASLEGQFFNPRALKKRFHEIRQLHNLKPCHFPPIQQRIYPRKNETS